MNTWFVFCQCGYGHEIVSDGHLLYARAMGNHCPERAFEVGRRAVTMELRPLLMSENPGRAA
jgi:hypothetical protein